MNLIKQIFSIIFLFVIFTQQGFADTSSTEQSGSNISGITLASTGIGLSLAGMACPIIGFVGELDNDRGKKIYGHGVGPGLNICGGILSYVAVYKLNKRHNPYGAFNDLQNLRNKVAVFTTIGCAATALSVLGSILFYSNIMVNDVTFIMTIPIGFVGQVFNLIAEIKSLRANIKYRKGLKE